MKVLVRSIKKLNQNSILFHCKTFALLGQFLFFETVKRLLQNDSSSYALSREKLKVIRKQDQDIIEAKAQDVQKNAKYAAEKKDDIRCEE